MSDTWVLFESGHLAKVRVTLYKAPGERSRLLDAYVTTECEGAVTRSARRAAEAVLGWLPEEHIPKEPMVAGFDLSGLPADITVTGESCGLAFAIALAAELTGASPGSIAATGILDGSNAQAEILPVKSACEKVKCAIHSLPTDSQILFPVANANELKGSIENEAKLKNIQLSAVGSVDNALNTVFGTKHKEEKPLVEGNGSQTGKLLFSAAVIVTVAVVCILLLGRKQEPVVENASQQTIPTNEPSQPQEAVSITRGQVTLQATTETEQKVAVLLATELSEQLQEKDEFSAALKIIQAQSSSGTDVINVVVEEVTFHREGTIEQLLADPVSMEDLNSGYGSLVDKIAGNILKSIPKQLAKPKDMQMDKPGTEEKFSSGKGFD